MIQILGRPYATFFPADAQQEDLPRRLLEQARTAGRVDTEGWRVRRDGTPFWGNAVLTALRGPDGQLRGYSKLVRDLSEQRAADQALRDSEATLRSLVQSAPDAILVVDGAGAIVSVNPRGEQMFGYDHDELVGCPVEVLVPGHLADVHRRYRDAYLRAPRTRPMGRGLDLTARKKDGSSFPVEVGLGIAGTAGPHGRLITVVVTDITDRKRAQAQLAHQATHDALTDLPNRALFLDRLGQALARTARRRRGRDNVAVLFFDLDRFTVVNDSLGHAAGDRLLIEVAHRLRDLLRPSDTFARFGGDEFAMLCEGLAGPADAARIAERALAAFAAPFVAGAGGVVVSPSIGIAVAREADTPPEGLLRDADAAMYQAKQQGRSRYELFDAELRADAVQRLEIENALRLALEHEQLSVAYQPIVAIGDGRPVGFEALARWHRPRHGSIGPDRFIPVAEETGMIVPLGAWVLDRACREAARWRERRPGGRPLSVSVNLSARQLAQPDLVEVVDRTLAVSGLPADLLQLEVTEGDLMRDADTSITVLQQLSSRGIRLAIDDFGTGYSSLSRLRRFPVDVLKVDRSFVDGLGREPADSAIVAAVVSLAQAYGITAVAEGVETAEQVRGLADLGCRYAQGFLYGPPQPAHGVDRLLHGL